MWKCPPYLASRSFARLSLQSELKKVKSSEEVAGVVREGRGDVCLTHRSALELYERRGTELRPLDPHPFTGACFGSEQAWLEWCRCSSWWEWQHVVYVTRAKNHRYRAHFDRRPQVVHVSLWLRFTKIHDLGQYYRSCRHGLLAYAAFPNLHPDMKISACNSTVG